MSRSCLDPFLNEERRAILLELPIRPSPFPAAPDLIVPRTHFGAVGISLCLRPFLCFDCPPSSFFFLRPETVFVRSFMPKSPTSTVESTLALSAIGLTQKIHNGFIVFHSLLMRSCTPAFGNVISSVSKLVFDASLSACIEEKFCYFVMSFRRRYI